MRANLESVCQKKITFKHKWAFSLAGSGGSRLNQAYECDPVDGYAPRSTAMGHPEREKQRIRGGIVASSQPPHATATLPRSAMLVH